MIYYIVYELLILFCRFEIIVFDGQIGRFEVACSTLLNDPPRPARHRELIVPQQCYPRRTIITLITQAANNQFARSGDLFIVRVKNEKTDNNNTYNRYIITYRYYEIPSATHPCFNTFSNLTQSGRWIIREYDVYHYDIIFDH